MGVLSTLTVCRNIWQKNWPEVHAAVTSGLPGFVFRSHPQPLGSSVPVFCYHVVGPQRFQADLDFLSQNGYVTIDGDTLLDHLTGRRQAPEGAVVLTFDDGSRNHYEVVFPLLKRYGMKGVAFIAPRFHAYNCNNPLLQPLSWQQIREMHESGAIDFQSHTYEHRYLPRWPEPVGLEGLDPEVAESLRGLALAIREDFRLSKEILEQKLNKPIRYLAFPRFTGTVEALHIGGECGYEGFWWGVIPHCPDNRPGQSPNYIVRLRPEFLRRLPGKGRMPLSWVLHEAYRTGTLASWGNRLKQLAQRAGS
jgi:peptidoglycan/xylan/chitin deacetylase (PgdA/CDA1 family)